MPKLPKFSDLTDLQGMLNKVKSVIESISGPSSSQATEEALEKETDPFKIKLLEVELLINQLHDVQLIQAKTLTELKNKYLALEKDVKGKLYPEESQIKPAEKDQQTMTEEKPAKAPKETQAGEQTTEKPDTTQTSKSEPENQKKDDES